MRDISVFLIIVSLQLSPLQNSVVSVGTGRSVLLGGGEHGGIESVSIVRVPKVLPWFGLMQEQL